MASRLEGCNPSTDSPEDWSTPTDEAQLVAEARKLAELQDLQLVPAAAVQDVKVSLRANNPLDVSPVSPWLNRTFPEAARTLNQQLILPNPFDSLLVMARKNPTLSVLDTQRGAFLEQARLVHMGSVAHNELEEAILIVENVTVWELLNNTFTPERTFVPDTDPQKPLRPYALSWPEIADAVARHLEFRPSQS